MAGRAVLKTGKDSDGDITKLCRPRELWSPRYKADVEWYSYILRPMEERMY